MDVSTELLVDFTKTLKMEACEKWPHFDFPGPVVIAEVEGLKEVIVAPLPDPDAWPFLVKLFVNRRYTLIRLAIACDVFSKVTDRTDDALPEPLPRGALQAEYEDGSEEVTMHLVTTIVTPTSNASYDTIYTWGEDGTPVWGDMHTTHLVGGRFYEGVATLFGPEAEVHWLVESQKKPNEGKDRLS